MIEDSAGRSRARVRPGRLRTRASARRGREAHGRFRRGWRGRTSWRDIYQNENKKYDFTDLSWLTSPVRATAGEDGNSADRLARRDRIGGRRRPAWGAVFFPITPSAPGWALVEQRQLHGRNAGYTTSSGASAHERLGSTSNCTVACPILNRAANPSHRSWMKASPGCPAGITRWHVKAVSVVLIGQT